MSTTNDRRGFLRGLASLPLIGGGVTLIGNPTAAAVAATPHLLEAYNEWLSLERSWLQWERFGRNGAEQQYSPDIEVVWREKATGKCWAIDVRHRAVGLRPHQRGEPRGCRDGCGRSRHLGRATSMNALVLSPSLRIVPVTGDGMEPTLRPRDFALCRPVKGYQGEGIYLLFDLAGGETFYRVDSGTGRDRVRLLLDNPHYQGGEVDRADFEARVQAIVLADIRTRVPVERWERLR